MNGTPDDDPADASLNPALKSTTDRTFDTIHRTPSPVSTTSAKAGDGEGWPWIWLVVTVVCVAIAIYLFV